MNKSNLYKIKPLKFVQYKPVLPTLSYMAKGVCVEYIIEESDDIWRLYIENAIDIYHPIKVKSLEDGIKKANSDHTKRLKRFLQK